MTVTKADLSGNLSDLGVSEDIAKNITQAILDSIIDSLKKGISVKISKFGTFLIKERKERKARNPKTGQTLTVPAKKVFAFRSSKFLKEAVK